MHIARYLKPEFVRLGLVHGHLDEIDPEKDRDAELQRLKFEVVDELVDLFGATGVVRNLNKFRTDMVNREKGSSTAVGMGIAVPHVRSMQPRSLGLIFARSREGVWYDAPDGELVHIFFGICSPVYDDQSSLSFYQWIAQSFLQESWLLPALLEAETADEIIGLLCTLQ